MAKYEKNEQISDSLEIDDPIFINRRLEALEREHEDEQKRDREYKDRQLKFNKFLTWFTGGLFLVSIGASFISAYELSEMRKATTEAHKAFAIGQRPWLGIDFSPAIRVEGARWKVNFNAKNYGLSPALHSTFPGEIASAPIAYDVVSKAG